MRVSARIILAWCMLKHQYVQTNKVLSDKKAKNVRNKFYLTACIHHGIPRVESTPSCCYSYTIVVNRQLNTANIYRATNKIMKKNLLFIKYGYIKKWC